MFYLVTSSPAPRHILDLVLLALKKSPRYREEYEYALHHLPVLLRTYEFPTILIAPKLPRRPLKFPHIKYLSQRNNHLTVLQTPQSIHHDPIPQPNPAPVLVIIGAGGMA